MTTTLTKSQINKGAKGIENLTGSLNQVLKQFSGILNRELPDTKGLTVRQWCEAFGLVPESETSTGFSMAALNKAWNPKMTETRKVKRGNKEIEISCKQIFRNVAKRVPTEEGSGKMENLYDANGNKISVYSLVDVEEGKWSIKTILRALRQGATYATHKESADESAKAWEKIKHVYVKREIKGEDGSTVIKYLEVNKNLVE